MPPVRFNPLRRTTLPVAAAPARRAPSPLRTNAVAADTFSTTAVDPGWLTRGQKPAVNSNVSFNAFYADAKAGKLKLPAEAKDLVYLTVPGLFNDRVMKYMADNERGLRQQGLEVKRVAVDGDGSTETNAKRVRDAILEASKNGKKVVLLGHSKGGVDATAALALYPELKEHVRAMVTMQSPLGGSPIANDLMSNGPLRGVTDKVVQLFGGDPNSVRDLTYENRKAFFAAHPYPSDIPTVCLASSTTNLFAPLGTSAAYIGRRYGEANDGLVVAKDAILPGSRTVLVQNLDHACMILKGMNGFSSLEPSESAQALIALALQN